MSRKWTASVEVARDKLCDQLQFSGMDAGAGWQMVDDLIHALAQQQRDWAGDALEFGDPEGLTAETAPGARWAADLIDPYYGVRPAGGEETTG